MIDVEREPLEEDGLPSGVDGRQLVGADAPECERCRGGFPGE
jgi:hypothetical protein